MALHQLLTYSQEDLLELARLSEEMFGDFNAAVASLDYAFARYVRAMQLWNVVGAPVALTIQSNLHGLVIPDDVRQKLGESTRSLDLSFATDAQLQVIYRAQALVA
jgi:hypothetical protein